jgi:hypothetical protein
MSHFYANSPAAAQPTSLIPDLDAYFMRYCELKRLFISPCADWLVNDPYTQLRLGNPPTFNPAPIDEAMFLITNSGMHVRVTANLNADQWGVVDRTRELLRGMNPRDPIYIHISFSADQVFAMAYSMEFIHKPENAAKTIGEYITSQCLTIPLNIYGQLCTTLAQLTPHCEIHIEGNTLVQYSRQNARHFRGLSRVPEVFRPLLELHTFPEVPYLDLRRDEEISFTELRKRLVWVEKVLVSTEAGRRAIETELEDLNKRRATCSSTIDKIVGLMNKTSEVVQINGEIFKEFNAACARERETMRELDKQIRIREKLLN